MAIFEHEHDWKLFKRSTKVYPNSSLGAKEITETLICNQCLGEQEVVKSETVDGASIVSELITESL